MCVTKLTLNTTSNSSENQAKINVLPHDGW